MSDVVKSIDFTSDIKLEQFYRLLQYGHPPPLLILHVSCWNILADGILRAGISVLTEYIVVLEYPYWQNIYLLEYPY